MNGDPRERAGDQCDRDRQEPAEARAIRSRRLETLAELRQIRVSPALERPAEEGVGADDAVAGPSTSKEQTALPA